LRSLVSDFSGQDNLGNAFRWDARRPKLM
jgi:hypothetical protein